MRILVINPGSTSTKIAVYDNLEQIWKANIHHETEDLKSFKHVSDQFGYRKELILSEIKKAGLPVNFNAVIGRGGLLHPLEGGVYNINSKMRDELMHPLREHASNLGALIAYEIANEIDGCRSFIADPVVVDELEEVARITGIPEIRRISIFHALNQKAIARRYAKETGKRYEDLNLIVAHLGGGVSIGAHRKGKVIDVNNALDGDGPISPERAGSIPTGQLVELCFSGKYTKDEIKKMLCGKGGMVAHLKTNNALAIEEAAIKGDEKSMLIMKVMIYQLAKSIGAMHAALKCQTDAILVTGGMAHSKILMNLLNDYIENIAPVKVYPGEDELGALAENAYNVLTGEYTAKEY